ncbi:MAG: 50S ribosomal protein L5 [Nitrososphaerota archaeon]
MEVAQLEQRPMQRVKIGKVVINVGVGKSGEPLERAKKMLTSLTSMAPSIRKAKKTIRDFGIHKGEPIALTLTLRGPRALEMLKRLLIAKNMRVPGSSFDENGGCSFGIKEHIDIPGTKYDPNIGIFGMDVCVQLEKPGYRVMRRRRARSKVGKKQRVSKEEAIQFFREVLKVEVV